MASYAYDKAFQQYTTASNEASARRIAALVKSWLPQTDSVADLGCGQGVWLAAWQATGVTEVLGFDGDYVDRSALRIAPSQFRPVDLTGQPMVLGRRFDLIECLEVAEHLPASSAAGLVHTLTSHSDVVLFSAAPPGQGGEHHINERPYGWWRDLFVAEGFALYDAVRPLVLSDPTVQPWYRYNVLLFVRRGCEDGLPEVVRATRLADDAPIADLSPLPYRARKALIRLLPAAVADGLARLKARLQR